MGIIPGKGNCVRDKGVDESACSEIGMYVR